MLRRITAAQTEIHKLDSFVCAATVIRNWLLGKWKEISLAKHN